jgi:hypothetical protein
MPSVTLSPLQSAAVGGSDFRELVYRPSDSLAVVVTGGSGTIAGREFTFRFDAGYLRSFILLDEGDLITIWESPHYVPNASILYEVSAGSLFETFSQHPGVLSVSMPDESLGRLHEYLIATDNDCLLALSSRPPHVEERPKSPNQAMQRTAPHSDA